jgi:hypothetical protein
MAPQGHGPLGETSRLAFGIQPVEPTRERGRADILAIRAERDQKFRMVRTCSTCVIVNGNPDGGKLREFKPLGGSHLLTTPSVSSYQ